MQPTLIRDLIPDVSQAPQTTQKSAVTGWTPRFDTYEPTLKAAADAAAKMVADMERGADPYWLTLIGSNGCGKTFLLRQIWQEAKRINPGNPKNNAIWPPDWMNWSSGESRFTSQRPYALFFDESGLASRMRAGDYNLPAGLRHDFFVGLDEVGITRDPTNFVSEAVGAVAENRLHRWTVFATNLTLQEISERMDARIASRMLRDENKVVVIKAGDYALT